MPERKAFFQEVEALLKDFDEQIQKVQAKAATYGEPSRIQRIADDLAQTRKELQDQFEHMKRAGAADWKDLRLGIENAREKLTMNVAKAMEAFES